MNDLIERIEAAREDNADLFRAAATAVFGFVPDVMNRFLAAGAFTDAALILVPKGRGSDVGGTIWNVEAWDGPGAHAQHVEATAWVCGAPRVHAATPALALCAAALKARAYLKETNNAD